MSATSGQRDGRMADFGALGAFLRRDEGASRFSAMLRDVKSGQITALTELSEYLSFSSEEALISFPTENFIQVLVGLLEDPGHDETAAQAIMLCCRCLFHIVDILPPATRIIAAAGGLPALCENLLNVAYIDVAELAVAIVERISEDHCGFHAMYSLACDTMGARSRIWCVPVRKGDRRWEATSQESEALRWKCCRRCRSLTS